MQNKVGQASLKRIAECVEHEALNYIAGMYIAEVYR